jgi:hypothetical protein
MAKQFSSLLKTCVCGVMLLTGVSCEKMNVEASDDDGSMANVVLRIGSIEQVPFPVMTRATMEELCSHLCFHIYDDDGIRVDYENQKADDANYGTASFLLDKGHYYLVVVGHSGAKNPSFSANEKVSISGDNLGDTFWCSRDFEVADDNVNLNLELQRIVSLLQFVPIVTPPADLDHIVFKYKGSKGTFNGLTGYGSTTSTQTVNVSTSSDESQYEFYMIPRDEEDMIDISMMAYNSDIYPLGGCTIDEVPVKRNCITVCRGNLFDGSNNSASAIIKVTIDDSWGDNTVINF